MKPHWMPLRAMLRLFGAAAMMVGASALCRAGDPVKLYPIVKDGKWGYMDDTGAVRIEPKYDQAFDFYEGLACVTVYPRRGYIDATGKVVIEPRFTWAGRFREGHAVVIESRKLYGGNPSYYQNPSTIRVIDRQGKYDKRARIRGGKAGFHEGKLVVAGRKRSDVFDRNLKKVEHDAERVCVFSEGTAPASRKNVWGYLDHSMKWVIEPRFDAADGFSEGMAAVGKNAAAEGRKRPKWGEPDRVWGFIDRNGNMVVEQKFNDCWRFTEGLAAVKVGDKWGYIDTSGRTVVQPAYDYAWPFSEGMARVLAGEKQGFIDKTGALVVKPQYRPAWDFSKGLARVTVEGREGYIDKKGEYVWEPTR
jgi:hypothetical protein